MSDVIYPSSSPCRRSLLVALRVAMAANGDFGKTSPSSSSSHLVTLVIVMAASGSHFFFRPGRSVAVAACLLCHLSLAPSTSQNFPSRVHRIVRLRVAINETLDPSHLSIRAYAQRMQLKSAVTAFGMEDTAPISALAPRASPNHSIPMHPRRDAPDLRSGQEPDSSEGRGRKEVKTLAQLRRRRLPSRGSGWLLPLDVYFRDDVLAVRLRFVPSHSRSPTPLSFRSPFSFFNPAARRSLLRSHEQT